MTEDIQVGDKVRRVPVEGVVDRITGDYARIQPGERWHPLNRLEVIEKAVITFRPGDVVKNKTTGYVYTIGVGGFLSHYRGFQWLQDPWSFTSENYELVK